MGRWADGRMGQEEEEGGRWETGRKEENRGRLTVTVADARAAWPSRAAALLLKTGHLSQPTLRFSLPERV